jgi:hypothetical protein
MSYDKMCEGALSLVLLHHETGCSQSALNAARLLDCLSEQHSLDAQTRDLCERASARLFGASQAETKHAGAA